MPVCYRATVKRQVRLFGGPKPSYWITATTVVVLTKQSPERLSSQSALEGSKATNFMKHWQLIGGWLYVRCRKCYYDFLHCGCTSVVFIGCQTGHACCTHKEKE